MVRLGLGRAAAGHGRLQVEHGQVGRLSTEEIGPKAVAGSFSSAAVRPVKCTSPAKASVMAVGAVPALTRWVAADDGRGAPRAARGKRCRG
jgi:hypothetical protein